ncbi:ATP-dependent rna helicase drs1 [Lasiodiplodia theobromae]|uniref:ATP-dependent rna helicase drs1 n=1 Tax=Lasiodiplodia theobromae TaxID=45133 RepID=UPI0015C3B1A9|nr:ATP-dependent rna helicase drs1 [Lasiodiplodia theobromae]KAF4546615.1 ATP-dependent rna helicase drs1 [Lasiodiplodia theobromae]
MATIQTNKSIGLVTHDTGSPEPRSPNGTVKATSSKVPARKNISGKGVKRSLGVASDEALGNEEDSSADEADKDDDDEPNEDAPSGGFGMGRGKRPAIHIEPADAERKDDRGTGLDQEGLLTPLSKKRTFSNTDIFAAFDEDAMSGNEKESALAYPRKKLNRKLSNNPNGLLAYEAFRKGSIASEEGPLIESENAIDSSDDDEIYKAVEDIDESDNDEYIDENLEEKALRDALNTSDNESDFGDGPDVSMLLDSGYLEGNLLDMGDDQILGLSGEQWAGMEEITPVQSNTSTRRVRFDDNVHAVSDVDSDDETSSEDLNSFFPDLFHKDNQALSSFRHSQDLDDIDYFDESTASDSERSYWDFGDEKELSSNSSDREHDVHTESGSESEAGSSGYETDEGDTTDEDLPPPPTINKPSRVHRDSSSSAGSATPKPFPRSKRQPPAKSSKRKGPIKGFFTLDPRRAIAILDSSGKRMVLRPARISNNQFWTASTASSTANNSPRSELQQLNGDDSDFSDGNTNFADIMLSGIYGAAGGLNYPIGPPEAFYPFVGIDADGTMEFDDEDDDDIEDMLDVNDFIDFGNQSDSDEADETDVPTAANSPTKAHAGHTPARAGLSAAHEMSQRMLQHFDRANVNSFRRNQNRYRDVARLPDDPAARAQASRPVRTGASADAIITPMRKKKKSSNMGVPRASPLAKKSGLIAGAFTPRRH